MTATKPILDDFRIAYDALKRVAQGQYPQDVEFLASLETWGKWDAEPSLTDDEIEAIRRIEAIP